MTPTGPAEPSLYEFSESTDLQVLNVVTIVYEVRALAERIRKSYAAVRIVGIDGFPSAGKTTLANHLSSMLLNADVVSTDDCVEIQGANRGGYVDRLNLTGIKDLVEKSIRAGRRVILEGICLREVIACSAIPTDSIVHVYVKRISKNRDDSFWIDEYWLEKFKCGEHVEPEPHLSAFRYHEKICPHKLANFEYRWRG